MGPGPWLRRTLMLAALVAVALAGCQSGTVGNNLDDVDGGEKPPDPPCKSGTDADGDGYGTGCAKGNDCDDSNKYIYPGATELCNGRDDDCDGKTDEGVTNACGTCDQVCAEVGKTGAFPTDASKDGNVKGVKGVVTDANGDLVLGKSALNFNYMWIANTYDNAGNGTCGKGQTSNSRCRGTISKVDTDKMREVARYYTVTCYSKGTSSGCVDINGKSIQKNHNHTPSRTAVDYNFDVWVANRSVHGGQPSATKIANDIYDCVDRNNNNKIDTSKDQNNDGKITVDCNGDGVLDSASTKCSGSLAGYTPEFLGDDDECIIMTVNYGESGDVGRSICLDMGKGMVGASNAWVGTFYRPERGHGNNKFYKIDGFTGKIAADVTLPSGHHSYGCMADAHNIVWSTDIYGSLTYFQTTSPYTVGAKLVAKPWVPKSGKTYHHYGITIDANNHVWLGGYHSTWVLRYRPNRSSFASLAKGAWSKVELNSSYVTRGIAADDRGFVWVAVEGGYVVRLSQSALQKDGAYDRTKTANVWPVSASTVIGVGVDFSGNVWAVGHGNDIASRLDVDKQGNVSATGTKNNVKIGQNPYTYSDFTGYGLLNFVRPSGRYVYQLNPCPKGVKAKWERVLWKATTPAGTAVKVRVKSGSSETTWGSWTQAFSASPADIGPKSKNPVTPNPSTYLQVEFTLQRQSNQTASPTLHDFGVSYTCQNVPN